MSDATFFFIFGVALMGGLIWLRRRYADFPAQRAEDYLDEHPAFEIKTHLNGEMQCDGIIFGPLGRVTSSFTANFSARWDGDVGIIDEVFTYQDGMSQTRQWRLELNASGNFTAWADDVPGGGKGRVVGSAVLLRYPIRLPENSGGHVLQAFDCMYLTPDGTIMNRSQFRKFGIKVAELVATIRKKETS